MKAERIKTIKKDVNWILRLFKVQPMAIIEADLLLIETDVRELANEIERLQAELAEIKGES